MDLTPKQQTSEAIRQAETILILTGQHPSVDQAVAVMALSALLTKLGKNVTAIISDNPPASTQMLEVGNVERGLAGPRDFVLKLDVTKAEVDKLRYDVTDGKLNIHLTPLRGSFAPSDVTFGYGEFHYDLAIVLGVPTRARIDRIYEQNASSFENIPLVNLDFHRSNENYGAVNLIEPNASSLCEMLVALSESLQAGSIDAEIATALLMGIMGSTDRFTATHTSPKSLTVAAQMMAAGARQQAVVRALYRDGKSEPQGGRGESRPQGEARNDDRRGEERRSNEDRRTNSDRRSDGRTNDGRDARSQGGQRQAQAEPQSRGGASAPRSASSRPNESERPEPRRDEASAAIEREELRRPAPERVELHPEPLPVPTEREERVSAFTPAPLEADREEILPPAHIEMINTMASNEEIAEIPAFAETPRPLRDETETTPEAVVAPVPTATTQMPMADFAAAAEMFNRDRNVDRPEADSARG